MELQFAPFLPVAVKKVSQSTYRCIANSTTNRPFYIPASLLKEDLPDAHVELSSSLEILILEALIGLNTCSDQQEKIFASFAENVKKEFAPLAVFEKINVLKACKLLPLPEDYLTCIAQKIKETEKSNFESIPSTESIDQFIAIMTQLRIERNGGYAPLPNPGNRVAIVQSPTGLVKTLPDTTLLCLRLQNNKDFYIYKRFLKKEFCSQARYVPSNYNEIVFVGEEEVNQEAHLIFQTVEIDQQDDGLFSLFIPLLMEYAFCIDNKKIVGELRLRCLPMVITILEQCAASQKSEEQALACGERALQLVRLFALNELEEYFTPEIIKFFYYYVFKDAAFMVDCLKACAKDYVTYTFNKKEIRNINVACATRIAEAFLRCHITALDKHMDPMHLVFLNLLERFQLRELKILARSIAQNFAELDSADPSLAELEAHVGRWEIIALQDHAWITPKTLLKICRELAKKYRRKTMDELHTVLAKENYRSVADLDRLLLEKITPSSEEAYYSVRPTILEAYEAYISRQLCPSKEYKRQTALTFLQACRPFDFQQEVLDQRSWVDLELFCGQQAHPSEYVASRVPTFTEMGHVFLLQKISNCTANRARLHKTQQQLRWLKDCQHFTELCKAFDDLREAETGVFSFWDNEDWIERQLDELLFNCFGLDKKSTSVRAFCDKLNSNQALLELVDRWKQVTTILATPVSVLGGIVASVFLPGMGEVGSQAVAISANSAGLSKTLPELIATFGETVVQLACFRICLRLKLVHLSSYFSAIDTINSILKKINGDAVFTEYLDRTSYEKSAELVKLREILAAGTFEDSNGFPSSSLDAVKIFGFSSGKILTAFNAIRLQKNKLIPVISALAELDILVSSAKLLKESETARAQYKTKEVQLIKQKASIQKQIDASVLLVRQLQDQKQFDNAYFHEEKMREAIAERDRLESQCKVPNVYCLPLFEEGQAVPHILLQGSWNPHLNASSIVTNDILIGGGVEPQNIVINGPNAGGKSSIMKGMIIAVIFAQSLGIAPACAMSFTPFNSIRAYLNITDDQAGGNSLFMAAVNRAFEVYQDVKKVGASDRLFSLTVFDELFNGTSSLEGEAAARTLIKFIGREPHNISLITTHFKSLMTLEDEFPALFTNYKVSVKQENGKLRYPFKLEKGLSDQCIAFEILEEKGFDQEFIDQCKLIIAQARGEGANRISGDTNNSNN